MSLGSVRLIAMRRFTVVSVVALSGLMLTACQSDEDTTAHSPDQAASTTTAEITSTTPETTTSQPSTTTQTQQSEPVIIDVDEALFTPSDSASTRLFKLADGTTECYINKLGVESLMTCRANFVNPPMVTDINGNQQPANAVSWSPVGVQWENMQFPPNTPQVVLEPNQRLTALGYACIAHGPSTVECSSDYGTASIANGTVQGASLPKTPTREGEGAAETAEN